MAPTYHRSAGFANHKMPQPYARGAGRPRKVSGMSSTPSGSGRPKSGEGSLDLIALSSHSLGPASARSEEYRSEAQQHFARYAADRPSPPSAPDRRSAAEAVGSPVSPAAVRPPRSPPMSSAHRQLPSKHAGFVPEPADTTPLSTFGQPLQASSPRSLRTTAAVRGTPMIQLARVRPSADAPITSLPLRFDSPSSSGGSSVPALPLDPQQRQQPLILELDGDEDETLPRASSDFRIARRPPGTVASWLRHGSPRAQVSVPQRETSLIYSDDECADRRAPEWPAALGPADEYEDRRYQDLEHPLDLQARPAFVSQAPTSRHAPSLAPQQRGVTWQTAPALLPASIDPAPLGATPPDSPFLARNNSTLKSARAFDNAPRSSSPLANDMPLFQAGRLPGRASVPARLPPQEEEEEAPVTLADLANERATEAPSPPAKAWPHPDAIRPASASGRAKAAARVLSPYEAHQSPERSAAATSVDVATSPDPACGAESAASIDAPARNPMGADGYGMICSQYGSFIVCGTSPAAVVQSSPPSPHAHAALRKPKAIPSAPCDHTDSPLSPLIAARRAARCNGGARNPQAARASLLGPAAFLFRRFPTQHWRVQRPPPAQVRMAELSRKPVRRPDWKRYAVLVRGLWLRANGPAQNGHASQASDASWI